MLVTPEQHHQVNHGAHVANQANDGGDIKAPGKELFLKHGRIGERSGAHQLGAQVGHE